MIININSEYLYLLKNRINLHKTPFSERGSRLLIFQFNKHLTTRLAERWYDREGQLAAYRTRRLDLVCCRAYIYEYPHFISGENPPNAASMFGWSPRMFIDLAIQAAHEKSQ